MKDKEDYMSREEIFELAKIFVSGGVKKIRLTGGEPLARKDVEGIIRDLSQLPIELAVTTNGVLVDKYIELFKEVNLRKINISLDSLDRDKNLFITKQDFFDRIFNNITMLCAEGIFPKINTVVMNNINSDEIIPFINLSKDLPLDIRFIEFMPFSGNQWELDKCMTYDAIIAKVKEHFGAQNIIKLKDKAGYTARSFKVRSYKGTFGIISSVSNPFCSGCNRIRLTADGKIKNCLFSSSEYDILDLLRKKQDVIPVIEQCIKEKKAIRAGMERMEEHFDRVSHKDRSMVLIGG